MLFATPPAVASPEWYDAGVEPLFVAGASSKAGTSSWTWTSDLGLALDAISMSNEPNSLEAQAIFSRIQSMSLDGLIMQRTYEGPVQLVQDELGAGVTNQLITLRLTPDGVQAWLQLPQGLSFRLLDFGSPQINVGDEWQSVGPRANTAFEVVGESREISIRYEDGTREFFTLGPDPGIHHRIIPAIEGTSVRSVLQQIAVSHTVHHEHLLSLPSIHDGVGFVQIEQVSGDQLIDDAKSLIFYNDHPTVAARAAAAVVLPESYEGTFALDRHEGPRSAFMANQFDGAAQETWFLLSGSSYEAAATYHSLVQQAANGNLTGIDMSMSTGRGQILLGVLHWATAAGNNQARDWVEHQTEYLTLEDGAAMDARSLASLIQVALILSDGDSDWDDQADEWLEDLLAQQVTDGPNAGAFPIRYPASYNEDVKLDASAAAAKALLQFGLPDNASSTWNAIEFNATNGRYQLHNDDAFFTYSSGLVLTAYASLDRPLRMAALNSIWTANPDASKMELFNTIFDNEHDLKTQASGMMGLHTAWQLEDGPFIVDAERRLTRLGEQWVTEGPQWIAIDGGRPEPYEALQEGPHGLVLAKVNKQFVLVDDLPQQLKPWTDGDEMPETVSARSTPAPFFMMLITLATIASIVRRR